VYGAPGLISSNVSSQRGLVNGTMGLMHSLTFDGNVVPELLRALDGRFQEIVLDEPPATVNMRVAGDETHTWHGVPLTADLERCTTGVAGLPPGVVPLATNAVFTTEHAVTWSLFSAQRNVPRKLRVVRHPYTLAFALTNFKLQSRTLPRLVLSLFHSPASPPHLTLCALYVFVSRVTTFDGLRLLLPPNRAELDKAAKLAHDPYLAAWEAAYDPATGRWSDEAALAAFQACRAPRAPRTRARRRT